MAGSTSPVAALSAASAGPAPGIGMLFKSILIPLGTLWLAYQSANFALDRTLP